MKSCNKIEIFLYKEKFSFFYCRNILLVGAYFFHVSTTLVCGVYAFKKACVYMQAFTVFKGMKRQVSFHLFFVCPLEVKQFEIYHLIHFIHECLKKLGKFFEILIFGLRDIGKIQKTFISIGKKDFFRKFLDNRKKNKIMSNMIFVF